jgi:flagellar hook-length control protein FliK
MDHSTDLVTHLATMQTGLSDNTFRMFGLVDEVNVRFHDELNSAKDALKGLEEESSLGKHSGNNLHKNKEQSAEIPVKNARQKEGGKQKAESAHVAPSDEKRISDKEKVEVPEQEAAPKKVEKTETPIEKANLNEEESALLKEEETEGEKGETFVRDVDPSLTQERDIEPLEADLTLAKESQEGKEVSAEDVWKDSGREALVEEESEPEQEIVDIDDRLGVLLTGQQQAESRMRQQVSKPVESEEVKISAMRPRLPQKKLSQNEKPQLAVEKHVEKKEDVEAETSDAENLLKGNGEQEELSLNGEERRRLLGALNAISQRSQLQATRPGGISPQLLAGLKALSGGAAGQQQISTTPMHTVQPAKNPGQILQQMGAEKSGKESNKSEQSEPEQRAKAMASKIQELRNRVIEQVKVRIQMLMRGEQVVSRIHLKPQMLGKVQVKLVQEATQLAAHFAVDNQTVKEALQRNIQFLKESLEERGFQVDLIEVEISNDQAQQGQGEGHGFSSQEEQNAAREWIGSFRRFGEDEVGTDVAPQTREEQIDPNQMINIVA